MKKKILNIISIVLGLLVAVCALVLPLATTYNVWKILEIDDILYQIVAVCFIVVAVMAILLIIANILDLCNSKNSEKSLKMKRTFTIIGLIFAIIAIALFIYTISIENINLLNVWLWIILGAEIVLCPLTNMNK